ncbi:MAG: hypothetical protein KBC22_02145 [Candidatus Pacebacteria bacterium]|nr:hypothetical protein [Candidatus Paceibacterota bacterium]
MEFFTIKNIFGVVAVALTFIGYAPYFLDLLRRKTKPHIFSWLIWAIIVSIIYALQVNAGAGIGSLVTLFVAIFSLLIFIIGFKDGNKDIKKIDVVFLVLALLTIPLWLVVKEPVLSIVLLSTIDMLGFGPTIRKSWHNPYSETLSFYIITTLRHTLSIVALANYNIITVLFPATWVIANAFFSIMLILRRRKIKDR